MTSTDPISAHYASGDLLARIAAALESAGGSLATATAADLKGVDEFHIGGLEATEALLSHVAITAETRVLDIGCGIGGTARHIAERHGADVLGVDLTPEFVEVATALTRAVGLEARFQVGGALALPVPDGSIDLATLIHVGMNISDKPALFSEVARCLAPGGAFAIFDIMRVGAGEIAYPVPWASAPEQSFVASPDDYRAAGSAAGLTLTHEENRAGFAKAFVAALAEKIATDGAPPVGLPLIMGADAKTKYANVTAAVSAGVVAPVEMVFSKPA